MSDAPIIDAGDDRDDAGAGVPVPVAEAAVERRDETRGETWILVRSVVLLVVIAAVLWARAAA